VKLLDDAGGHWQRGTSGIPGKGGKRNAGSTFAGGKERFRGEFHRGGTAKDIYLAVVGRTCLRGLGGKPKAKRFKWGGNGKRKEN